MCTGVFHYLLNFDLHFMYSELIFYFVYNFLLQICGPLLDESQVRSIVEELKQVITASSARRTERAERVKAEDFDAEEGEMLKEENELEEELFDQVCFYFSHHEYQHLLLLF